jgi:hypothetical protein
MALRYSCTLSFSRRCCSIIAVKSWRFSPFRREVWSRESSCRSARVERCYLGTRRTTMAINEDHEDQYDGQWTSKAVSVNPHPVISLLSSVCRTVVPYRAYQRFFLGSPSLSRPFKGLEDQRTTTWGRQGETAVERCVPNICAPYSIVGQGCGMKGNGARVDDVSPQGCKVFSREKCSFSAEIPSLIIVCGHRIFRRTMVSQSLRMHVN